MGYDCRDCWKQQTEWKWCKLDEDDALHKSKFDWKKKTIEYTEQQEEATVAALILRQWCNNVSSKSL